MVERCKKVVEQGSARAESDREVLPLLKSSVCARAKGSSYQQILHAAPGKRKESVADFKQFLYRVSQRWHLQRLWSGRISSKALHCGHV